MLLIFSCLVTLQISGGMHFSVIFAQIFGLLSLCLFLYVLRLPALIIGFSASRSHIINRSRILALGVPLAVSLSALSGRGTSAL